MNRVAIVGFAGTKEDTPFQDLAMEWWGMNELYAWARPKTEAVGRPSFDRWFELHDMQVITSSYEDQAHLKWLQAQPEGRPIYMLETHEDIPASVRFPIERVCKVFGRYFTSSIGYMLALAILQGRDDNLKAIDPEATYGWIGLYGIDLASDTEYGDQRPNAEYLVGLARGLGIEVFIPKGAALLQAARLYGYEPGLGDGPVGEEYDQKRITQLTAQREQALAVVHTVEGAMQEAENRVKLRRHLARGAFIPGWSSMAGAPMIPAGRTSDGHAMAKAVTAGPLATGRP